MCIRDREGTPCQICIMDMRLPDMDGNTAIRTLHQMYPEMEFLIHTGSSSYSLPDDLRALGLDDDRVYQKPVSYTHLDVYKRQPLFVPVATQMVLS